MFAFQYFWFSTIYNYLHLLCKTDEIGTDFLSTLFTFDLNFRNFKGWITFRSDVLDGSLSRSVWFYFKPPERCKTNHIAIKWTKYEKRSWTCSFAQNLMNYKYFKIRLSVTWIKYLGAEEKHSIVCDFGDKLYGKIKTSI